jgi:hypothetical protein
LAVWYTGERQLGSAAAEADRLDPGWRWEDLQARRRPMPPPGQNGMDQIEAIKAAMPKGRYPLWSFPAYEMDLEKLEDARVALTQSLYGEREIPALLNEEQVRVLAAERNRTADALALARALVNFPFGRLASADAPVGYSSAPPQFGLVRDPTLDLLRYDALLRSHSGDITGALQDVAALLHASRCIGDEPGFMPQFIRIAVDTTAALALERALGLGTATEESLAALQHDLQEECAVDFFLVMVRGERIGLDRHLAAIQHGEVSFSDFSVEANMLFFDPTDPSFGADSSEHLKKLHHLQAYLTIRGHRAQAMRLMNELVEIAKLAEPEQTSAIQAFEDKLSAMPKWNLASAIVRHFGNVCHTDKRTKVHLRAAQAAVAAERFRLQRGRWPQQLVELVPYYLQAFPLDPYDGQPLRMKRGDGVFIVYSVGKDGVDDGGNIDDGPWPEKARDIGFRLFDPARRRQPAKPWVFPPKQPEPEDDFPW